MCREILGSLTPIKGTSSDTRDRIRSYVVYDYSFLISLVY
jgi:hypothetical protein